MISNPSSLGVEGYDAAIAQAELLFGSHGADVPVSGAQKVLVGQDGLLPLDGSAAKGVGEVV